MTTLEGAKINPTIGLSHFCKNPIEGNDFPTSEAKMYCKNQYEIDVDVDLHSIRNTLWLAESENRFLYRLLCTREIKSK